MLQRPYMGCLQMYESIKGVRCKNRRYDISMLLIFRQTRSQQLYFLPGTAKLASLEETLCQSTLIESKHQALDPFSVSTSKACISLASVGGEAKHLSFPLINLSLLVDSVSKSIF